MLTEEKIARDYEEATRKVEQIVKILKTLHKLDLVPINTKADYYRMLVESQYRITASLGKIFKNQL